MSAEEKIVAKPTDAPPATGQAPETVIPEANAPALEPLAADAAKNGEDALTDLKPAREINVGGGRKQLDIEVESRADKRKLIIGLMWPALAENILASLVSMVDMMMVSGLGAYAISAVGLVTQPRFIMLSAFMAFNVGTTALVARAKGARNPKEANDILMQSLLLSTVLTVVLCAVMLVFNKPLIRFIAGETISEQTIQAAIAYFRVQLYGFPLLSLTFTMNAALRGAGNTRAAFYNNTAANLVNVFFNYCLINGKLGFPAMGVEGASIATVIGQGVAFLMATFILVRGKQYVRFVFKELRVRWDVLKRIFNIGLPALIEQVLMRVGMMLFTITVTSLGDNPYAAHMVAMNIQQLSFTTGMAFGTAATTLVGQCLGRVREDLARVYIRITMNMNLVVSVIVAVGLFFFGGTVARLYSTDVLILGLAAQVLRIMAVANPLSNARFVYTSALRGAGDSRFTAVITFVGVLIVRPLVSYVLVNFAGMGLVGVWIALVSDSVVCYFLALMRYRGGKWAKLKV